MTGYVVRNQTPCRLRLVGGGQVLDLAPLETRQMTYAPAVLGTALSEAERKGVLAWDTEPVREVRERWAAGVLVVAALATAWLAVSAWRREWDTVAVATVALALVALLLSVLNRFAHDGGRTWKLRRRSAEPDDFNSWQFARGVAQRVLHIVLLLVVLAVGVAVPLAAVWYGTGLPLLLDQLDGPTDGAVVANELVARGLHLLLIALLVLMPALMYFWFDREKVETLLDRWLAHIFRFDPTLRTLGEVDAKYGRRLEEAYGARASGVSLRFQQRARSRAPVVMATLLVALGWVLVLVNIGSDLVANDDGGGQERAIAGTAVLFEVANTPISFAFLGAYVYALQVVFRGYVRGDLRPKTYNAISVRMIVAFVLAGVLEGVLPDDSAGARVALAGAFLAGIVPDTVLRRIRDLAGWHQHRQDRDELADELPLTDLVGIDLYERTRLAEDGITNVQALAHHDVVALTLSTRIPFERVVNWVDQAVLYEHVSRAQRAALRRIGITTATALLEVWRAEPVALQAAVPELQVGLVVQALQRADWVPMLLAWRTHRQVAVPALYRFPRDDASSAPLTVVDLTSEPPRSASPSAAEVDPLAAPAGRT